jgi:predicted nucleic acid-binding protein
LSGLSYADSSFLFSFYGVDAHTKQALAVLTAKRDILVSDLAEFEFMQGVRLQMFQHDHQRTVGLRREIGLGMLSQFNQDLGSGIYHRKSCDWQTVFQRANSLSAEYTREEGHRSMDLLHLAIASELCLKIFFTFDKKQRALAETLGFETGI